MIRSFLLAAALVLAASHLTSATAAEPGQPGNWQRFYHYPYVYYPQSFERPRANNHLYYRYPHSMRMPVYNDSWHNAYPAERPYHWGHHFILDVF